VVSGVSDYFYGVAPVPARNKQQHPGALPSQPRGIVSIGRVARLFVGQCYGYIRLANNREIYFHRSDLHEGTSINDLRVGDPVTFELLEDRISGARAVHVKRRRPIR
jgi:cold shock CspA family protein